MNEIVRLLIFRLSAEEFAALTGKHLLFGLAATWIVGIGRWWDDPTATMLQRTGIGSVAYVVVLSVLLWLVVKPLNPRNWSYPKVLTFVSMTAPPAVLYAIPVEKFLPLEAAAQLNLVFLLIVSTWRVALLGVFLHRHAGLSPGRVTVAVLLPLTGIVVGLTYLNLMRGVIAIMGGLRNKTVNYVADNVVAFLGFASHLTILPLLIVYLVLVVLSRRPHG